jgi:hypothetical protein
MAEDHMAGGSHDTGHMADNHVAGGPHDRGPQWPEGHMPGGHITEDHMPGGHGGQVAQIAQKASLSSRYLSHEARVRGPVGRLEL